MIFCVSYFLLPSNFIAEVWQADKDLSGGQKHQMRGRHGGGEALLEEDDKEDNEEDDDEEDDDEEYNKEDNDEEDDDEEDTTMPAHKTSIGGSSMKKTIPKSGSKTKKVQDINDVTAAMKSLSFSGGVFSQSVINGYSVGTLTWMDKTTLQKYVEP